MRWEDRLAPFNLVAMPTIGCPSVLAIAESVGGESIRTSIGNDNAKCLTILAGPVAEMVYRDEPLHPAHYGPWHSDWQMAWMLSETLVPDPARRTEMLEQLILQLHHFVKAEPCWPAIAALSDELTAHEFLEAEQIEETIGFWFRNG